MKAKKIIIIAMLMAFFVPSMAHAAIFKKEEVVEQQARSNYPPKYDDIYLEQLKKEMEDYIYYYNNERITVGLKGLTPTAVREQLTTQLSTQS